MEHKHSENIEFNCPSKFLNPELSTRWQEKKSKEREFEYFFFCQTQTVQCKGQSNFEGGWQIVIIEWDYCSRGRRKVSSLNLSPGNPLAMPTFFFIHRLCLIKIHENTRGLSAILYIYGDVYLATYLYKMFVRVWPYTLGHLVYDSYNQRLRWKEPTLAL